MTQAATETPTPVTIESPAERLGRVADSPPGWLRFVALASAAGVLTFGAAGLALAINGWYRPALAFPIGGVLWIGVLLLAWPVIRPATPVSRSGHAYAAVGVAFVLAITVWNTAHASQHVLVNRDGGSYANTARWIARDGSLSVDPRVGPFATAKSIEFESPAVQAKPNGTLQFQFAHMLPVVLAEAYAIGGDTGLFHAPELLGGIALLAFFILAWRLFRRPFFALAAMLALAFIIPQVSFSRDSYSEIPSQILLFTALWLLVTRRPMPHWRIALAAGLFLGALEGVRVDAIVFLAGVPVLFAIAWLRVARSDSRDERRAVVASIIAFSGGVVPGMVLGLIDLSRHSGHYFHDLAKQVRELRLMVLASVVASVIIVLAWPVLWRALRRLRWPTVANVAAVLVALVGFAAWFVRPRIQHLHGAAYALIGGLQAAEHVAVDPTRNYFERSMVWMAWYLGPLTLAVAIIGAGLLVRELLLGRMRRVVGALVVLVPGSMLYLYRASAVSDHVWVTRRFLVSSFPLLILLALGLASACVGLGSGGRVRTAWRVGAVVFAVCAVAYPLKTVIGVRSMTEDRGFLAIVHQACDDMGDHPAVVVLVNAQADALGRDIPQTLRGWCGADVGVMNTSVGATALHDLAAQWGAEGRPLYVVATNADVVNDVLSGIPVEPTARAVNPYFLQQTLTRRPSAYAPQAFQMVVARVPTS